MTREEALTILRRDKPRLTERYGIKQIGLFGSVARNEATPESDVDIIVDVPITDAWEFFSLVDEIKTAFPVPVDVVRLHPNLRPFFLERLARDGVYV
jgi:predicted nucleotidyltransferase